MFDVRCEDNPASPEGYSESVSRAGGVTCQGILSDYKAAFGLGDRDAVLLCCLQPKAHRFLSITDGFSARVPVRHAAGELGNVDNEGVIFVAPPDDHFVTRILHRLKKFILCQNFAHLSYLVRLGFRSFTLEIDSFHNAKFRKNVVATRDTHPKALGLQELTDVIEANVCVGFFALIPYSWHSA